MVTELGRNCQKNFTKLGLQCDCFRWNRILTRSFRMVILALVPDFDMIPTDHQARTLYTCIYMYFVVLITRNTL